MHDSQPDSASTRESARAPRPGFESRLAGSPTAAGSPRAENATLARRTLVQALLLGIFADALLRDGPWGIGLLLWMTAFGAGVIALAWRRGTRVTREQIAWLAASLFFAACFSWRDAEELQVFDFLAMLASLTLLATTMSLASPLRSVLGARVRDLVLGAARTALNVAAAVLPLTFIDSHLGAARNQLNGARSRAVLRGALITLPLLLLFGALLGEADPVFGSFFKLPGLDIGLVMSHIVVAGFFTWVTGGWMRGALVESRPRSAAPDGFPLTLGALEIGIALGALASLFAAFVAVQVGWLFGGEALVRSTTGLGYAEYARRGFFELVWVSLLVLPVLLGTRAAIAPGDDRAVTWHRRLSLPVLLLLGAIMLSALGRMRLYVDYYGLTSDRFFATVFMLWLAVVFVWFGVTVLRGRERDFAAGMTITGFFTLAAINAANPDAIVARVNVARAPNAVTRVDSVALNPDGTRGTIASWRSPIDYRYLSALLSGDAAPVVVRALLAPPTSPAASPARDLEVKARCDAVRELLTEWGNGTPRDSGAVRQEEDWRRWNFGASRARAVVRENEAGLRAVTCLDSGVETPFGAREKRKAVPGEQWYVPPPLAADGSR